MDGGNFGEAIRVRPSYDSSRCREGRVGLGMSTIAVEVGFILPPQPFSALRERQPAPCATLDNALQILHRRHFCLKGCGEFAGHALGGDSDGIVEILEGVLDNRGLVDFAEQKPNGSGRPGWCASNRPRPKDRNLVCRPTPA
jgi:hypothetical protein